jgi:hypothetical protein
MSQCTHIQYDDKKINKNKIEKNFGEEYEVVKRKQTTLSFVNSQIKVFFMVLSVLGVGRMTNSNYQDNA